MKFDFKRFMSLFLSIMMVVSLVPTVVFADETAIVAEADETAITTISTVDDLKAFADAVNDGNSYEDKTVTLTADLDLTGIEWTPIGNGIRKSSSYEGNAFKGTFDGGNHTIEGLTAPLFGVVTGTVQDVNLVADIDDTANDSVGAAVAILVGGTIDDVDVSGSVTAVEAVGGVVGRVLAIGTVKKCDNTADVTSTGKGDAAGGIVGKAYYTSTSGVMSIADCTNSGAITSGYAAGGIVGFSAANISGCTNSGAVTGASGTGGIVGEQTNYGTLTENSNTDTGYINGYCAGGIVGWTRYQNNASAYLVTETVTISNNENTAAVIGTYSAGGIAGLIYNQATVTANENSAPSIGAEGCVFAGGIVGGLQQEPNNADIDNATFTVSSNTTTTTADNITANCKDEVAYDNPQNSTITGNISPSVVAENVAFVNGTGYTSLQAALDAAAAGTGNVTVEILDDIDLTGIEWNPVTVSAPGYPCVTVNGNDKTITGLNDMLFAGTWAGGSGLIINDLTIKDSAIVHDKDDAKGNIGVGAFIGYPQASATITLNNCHLENSSVEGGHWTGGLIGMAGGYNGNDGPVFMNLTIENCSVTGSTITGKGSVGGVIGHGSCAAWTKVVIENTTVSDNTITSTGSSNDKAGAIMGTIGAAGQSVTVNGETKTGGASVSATVNGNTVTSNETTITTIYGRQGTETGMLYVAGGSYEKNPIEENVAYAAPAPGYKIVENAGGTYGVEVDPAYGKVAMVGENYYEDLQDAIVAAAPNGTVEIIADVTVDEWVMFSESLSIGSGQIITLDMNGLTINGNNHTLTVNSIESASNGGRLFYDATELNINDLTINYADGVVGGIGLTSGTISNVTFNGGVGVFPGTGDITITECTFNTSGSAIYNEEERDNLVVTGNTFNTAAGQYAIYLRGNTTFTGNTVVTGKVNVTNSATGTISGNDFGTERFKVYNGATATISDNTINNLVFNDNTAAKATFTNNTMSAEAQAAYEKVLPVASVNGTDYTSFADAMTAANAMTGDVVVGIYGEVEFVDGMELKGSYTSITFNGIKADAKITINQTAGGDYLEAHGKTVAFNSLILAKANPAWSGNSGHMGNYFSVQGGTVTYTNCTFPNGACTSGGTATYTGCTFENTSEYGLWVYDDALVTVDGGTIDSKKGIKVYSEDEASVTSTLTVQNATFTANVTSKPAVAIGYAESITLIGNTYNNTTGVLELDSGSDADCEGVTFVAKDAEGNDISSTLTAVDRSKASAPCGVLVDGKIYTTVTEAAKEVESGDTVTLMYDSTEAVELPAGVILNKNGHTADGVTVALAKIAAYVKEVDGYVRVWGESGALASESFVLKLYSDSTLVATTTLNNVGGIINGDVNVTWNFFYPTSNDPYWTTTWEEGHPNSKFIPTRIELYADGKIVADGDVRMSGPDNLNPVTWRKLGGVKIADLEGEGTAANPFMISTLAELKFFRDDVNGGNTYSGKVVALAEDIDLASEEWTPIGNSTNKFQGTFDGQDHTIFNLVITGYNSDVGLFGFTTNGEIKNLTVENAKVSGRLNVGVVAGTPYTSKYTNIKVTGHVEVNGMAYVGGVGGKNAYANWTDITVDVDGTSYVNAISTEDGTAYRTYVGGVIGFIGEGSHTFSNISSNIKVIGDVCDIGGLFGIAHYGNNFENVTFTGAVEAPEGAEEVGGIAGVWHNANGYTVTFTDVTSTGTVTVGETITTKSVVGGAYYPSNETPGTSGSLIIEGEEAWLKVAQVGETKYATFAEAVAAAQAGDTVVLLSDITLTETLHITAGKVVTLDLNGKTIDGTEKVNIALMSYGDLTIKDTSAEANGMIKAGVGTAGNAINICGGTFTLESGNIYSKNNAILVDEEAATINVLGGTITAEPNTKNSAVFYISSTSDTIVNITGGEMVGYNGILLWNNTEIEMTGGSIEAKGSVGIQGNGSKDNTKISISGGNVSGYYTAIYHPQGGELTISGGELTGWSGVVVKGGKVTISGGTISGTGEAGAYEPVSSGFTDTGDGLYIEVYDNSTNSENYGTPVVTITGGKFTSENSEAVASYANSNNNVEALEKFIYGGTYNTEVPADLCGLGYVPTSYIENGETVYGVKAGVEAKIGLIPYATLAEAIEAAREGDQILLQASVVVTENIQINKNVNIVDYNTYTITFANGAGFVVGENASLTLTNILAVGGISDVTVFSATPSYFVVLDGANAAVTIENVATDSLIYVSADADGSTIAADDKTVVLEAGAEGITITGTTNIEGAQARIGNKYYSTIQEAIAVAQVGETVTILEGTYAVPTLKAGITVEGEGDVLLKGTLSGTLEDLTLKNLHIKGANAQRWAYAKGNLEFENVTFEATSVYALHFDGIDEGTTLLYKNCTIIGWAAMGGSPASCEFVGCTIKDNGSYGVIRTYFDATIEDCTFDVADANFNDVFEDGIHAVDGAEVVVTGCTNVNGDMKELVNVSGASVVDLDGVKIQNVAKIGDSYYATIAEAVAAAQTDDTITLLTDVVLEDTLTVAADKTIVLDLNGKTISQTKAQTAGYQMILNDGALTIKDSVGGGKISYTDSGNGGEYISDTIYNRGTLVIDGGTIENLSSATVASNGYPHAVDTYSGLRDTSVTINGGTIYCAEYSAIRMFCVSATKKADLTINDGTIKGAVDMQNGTKDEALGSLTINGGTFEITKNANNIRFANWNGGATEYGITAEIKGGSFNGGITTQYVPAAANWDSKIISGGTFSSDSITAYLADGFMLNQNANGTYGVVVDPAYGKAAKIGDEYYETLKEAFADLKDNDTLTILAGTYSEGTIKLPATLKNVTIHGEDGAVLKDMTIMAHDGNSLDYDGITFNNIDFHNSRISITGWRNNGVSVKNLTVTDCTFHGLDDTTNSAPVHINMAATEAVENFTFTNNVIDGATGGSKSGIYAQFTGKTVLTDNVINNVAFRPYVIQLTTDDGIDDEFIVTGNTFSGSAAGRAQALTNNAAGTDTVKLVVSGNIFEDITTQQICYWNFNADTTTADFSKNYYDIEVLANPSSFYFNSAAKDGSDLADMGIFPIYTELNADGTINENSAEELPAIMVTYPVGNPVYPEGKVEYYDNVLEAVPYTTNCPRLEGATITLLKDTSGAGLRFMENDMVFDLNGHTYTITDGTGSQGTNTSGFQIRPEVTTNVTFKNGTIKVAEDAPVVWMFNCYATDFVVEDVTVDCANMAWGYGESCYVAVSRSGDNVQFTGNTKIENFNAAVAGNAINVGGTMTIADTVDLGELIVELDAGATLTAPEGLNVVTADGYTVDYENGVYKTVKILLGSGTEEAPYLIKTVDDLILFRDSVNAGETKYNAPGVYVELAADIDLAGQNWIGIGSATAEHGFMGNFDGKTYKIKNLTITNPTVDADGYAYAGLFGITEGTDKDNQNVIENLTIENVTISTSGHIVAAAIAYPYYTIVQNVKVCGNISITGGDYTAGALAYTRRCVDASNVTVEGTTGSAITGKSTVGGVISDIQMNGGLTANYSNFSVSDVTVSGDTCVGGISGIIATQTLNGATVKNVTLVCSDARVGVVAGAFGGTSTISNVTAENVTGATAIIGGAYDGSAPVEAKIGDTYYATLADAMAAAQDSDTITLLAPIVVNAGETLTLNKAVTITYTSDVPGEDMITNKGNLVIDGATLVYTNTDTTANNVTVSTISCEPGSTLEVKSGTVKNDSANNGALGIYAFTIDILTNGTLGDVTATISGGEVISTNYMAIRQFNNGTACKNTLTVTGGSIYGAKRAIQVHLDNDAAYTTISGGKVEAGEGGYALCLFPTVATNIHVTGGEFIGTVYSGTNGFISGGTFDEELYSAYLEDGFKQEQNADDTYGVVVDPAYGMAAKIGDKYYETFEEALAAVGDGDVVIELCSNATLDYNAREAYGTAGTTSITINGNGYTLTLNQKDSDWSSIGMANADGKLTLENMTIEKTGYGDTSGEWNTHAIQFTCNVEMKDVTINNAIAVENGATLNNVTINEANGYYGLWISGNGQSVTVNGGAINATNGGRGIKIADEYVDSPAKVTLSVTDMTFNTAEKAAVLVSSTAGADVTASGCDITSVAADNTNFVWNDEDWAAYYNNVKVHDEATKSQENEESFAIVVYKSNAQGTIRAYFKTLDELFAAKSTQIPLSDNYIELRDDVVAENRVNISYGNNWYYNFGTSVEEGVIMTFKYADNWNYLPHFCLGENVTLNVPYLQVIGGDIEIAGTINTDYLYLYGTGEGVTVTETGVVNVMTGDATVQVKGGTVLTVNGELNTSTLNVWTQDTNNSELIVSGANAKVNASHLHAWNGKDGVSAQKVVVENGATLTAINFKADRGSEVTVDAATLTADSLTLGYEDNIGTLTVKNNGVITNGVVLTGVNSTVEGPEGMNVTTNIADHKVVYENGVYKVVAKVYVAQIGETKYETLADALTAAQDGETVTLLWTEGDAPIAMNGAVYGKTVTITGTATVDWSKGFLFVGRGGAGNGTVIFDNANLTSASDNASTGIHVSGREKDAADKYDGTLTIKNSTIVLDYLINKGTMTLDNSTLTVKNGCSLGGRPGSETESGEDATATISLTNGSKLIVNNHNGMGLGYEAIGIMNVDATSTFETTQSFLVTAKGTMNLAGTATIAGTLTNEGKIVLTDVNATLTSSECGNVTTNVDGYEVVYENGVYKVAKVEVEEPAGTITHVGLSLSLTGIVYINDYVKLTGFDGVDLSTNAGLLIWNNEVTEDAATFASADKVNVGLNNGTQGYWQCTDGIPASEYADELWLRVYVQANDGTYYYGPLKEYSVQTYCQNQINKSSTEESFKELCAAMLHYGAAAQILFNNNTSDLANANILDSYPPAEWNSDLLTELETAQHSLQNTNDVKSNKSLSLTGAIAVNFYFNPTNADWTVASGKVYFWDGVSGELSTSNASYTVDMVHGTNGWYATSNGFAASEYGKTVFAYAEIKDTAGNIHYSDVIAYSPETYAENKIIQNSDEKLVDLVKKMVIYGACADAHFEN